MTRLFLMTCLALASAVMPSAAWAQVGPPPPPPAQPMGPGGMAPVYYGPPPNSIRYGLLFGLSLGVGSVSQSCDVCTTESEGGVTAGLRIGGFINPSLGIMVEGWGTAINPSDGDYVEIHSINTVAVQGWVSPRFWLKGGIGFGQISASDQAYDYELPTGLALTGALGYELAQSGPFAFDLSLQFGATFFDDDFAQEVQFNQAALLAGFNWY